MLIFQVDTLDSSQLLVSVCSPESLNQSAAIGYLPVADLSGPAFCEFIKCDDSEIVLLYNIPCISTPHSNSSYDITLYTCF